MTDRPPYTVITVAYRSAALIGAMFRRLRPAVPIIVVDNSRADEDLTGLVATRPTAVYVDAGGNVGFGAACNLAAAAAETPLIAFVNPDADVDAAVLDELAREVARDARCSSCGPTLVDAAGTVRSGSGGWLPTPRRALVHAAGLFCVWPRAGIWMGPGGAATQSVQWLAGTCLMIRREVFAAVGGFAPRYFLYQEDMDLGRRLYERGYRQALRRDLRIRHAGGTSSARQDDRQLAWRRASALVDYVCATMPPLRSQVTCGILALGAIGRAGLDLARGRTGRLDEFGTQARTLACPRRTLARLHSEHPHRFASRQR